MKKPALLPISLAAGVALAVAIMGGTITVLDDWYYSLAQPYWAPPDFAFAIVWTIVFALIAISGLLAWENSGDRRTAETVIGLFAINGFLNLGWSFLFFRMQRPDWAFYEVIIFLLSIMVLIVYCGRLSRTSAVLLLPYLAWVSIAAALNYEVIRLNGPFG